MNSGLFVHTHQTKSKQNSPSALLLPPASDHPIPSSLKRTKFVLNLVHTPSLQHISSSLIPPINPSSPSPQISYLPYSRIIHCAQQLNSPLPKEMEDYNFDYEMFDLKPIIPEIYTTVVHQQQPQTFGRSNAGNGMRMMVMGSSTSWNSCDAHQIIMNTNPSSSSSNSSPAAATATASAPPQLISFQNTSSYLPTHSDTAPNCANYNLEMSKDYISGTPQVISFCAANWADEDDCGRPDNQYHDAANIGVSNKRVCTASRTPLQAQDHLVAERKRRERLGQLFITLSKVVPGLKKLDKASLLEDAINYLKALQERVNALEEEDQVVKKSSNMDDDHDHNSSSHNYNNIGSTISTTDQSSAEIRARISNRHVLIKICCRKQMGLISRIPCEMEKMHLSVIDMRVMPFGGVALDITILAEMHSEFRGTVKEIVGHLQMSLLKAAA